MKTHLLTLILLMSAGVAMHAQNSYQQLAKSLESELQKNAQDSYYKRNVRFNVELNLDNSITVIHRWQHKNGRLGHTAITFHPRNIVSLRTDYYNVNSMAVSIICEEETVSNEFLNSIHLNSTVRIPCLKHDDAALDNIRSIIRQLHDLSSQ